MYVNINILFVYYLYNMRSVAINSIHSSPLVVGWFGGVAGVGGCVGSAVGPRKIFYYATCDLVHIL